MGAEDTPAGLCDFQLLPPNPTRPRVPWQRQVWVAEDSWSGCKSPEMTKSLGLMAGEGRGQALETRDKIRWGLPTPLLLPAALSLARYLRPPHLRLHHFQVCFSPLMPRGLPMCSPMSQSRRKSRPALGHLVLLLEVRVASQA